MKGQLVGFLIDFVVETIKKIRMANKQKKSKKTDFIQDGVKALNDFEKQHEENNSKQHFFSSKVFLVNFLTYAKAKFPAFRRLKTGDIETIVEQYLNTEK